MSKRRNRRGHFCWCCGRLLANERFSAAGRRQHLCKACKRLGKEELAFRQRQRDIDRLLTWDGTIPRRHRASFERYLTHPDQRVRQYACEVKQHDAKQRQQWHEMLEAERLEEEQLEQNQERLEQEGLARCRDVSDEADNADASAWQSEDIPF